jgi:hypothetical protein
MSGTNGDPPTGVNEPEKPYFYPRIHRGPLTVPLEHIGLDDVCERLGRLLTSLQVEINSNYVVRGEIAEDIRKFRNHLTERLVSDGWHFRWTGKCMEAKPPEWFVRRIPPQFKRRF